ncbi:MAG: alpha-L-fucosidase [Prevotella sp.]|nr:alpha-L-fucosidase [Prevotella sp.]
MKKQFLDLAIVAAALLPGATPASAQEPTGEPVEQGQYTADWESLKQWECPEWYRDAKFGIWAHWGPQCQAEDGDWYGRFMYYEGSGQYNYHVQNFGNPKDFGLKELCNAWKAEQWDPEELVKLYKSVGAQFFFTLGQHHDNFDLWDSPYQEWNSVNVGPRRDIVKGWADACKKYGLPLGVSIHGAHTWTWLEPSQRFDGNLTREDGYELNADGTEKWWKGMDPQELYAQGHAHSTGWDNSGTIHSQWDWGNGASQPSEQFKKKLQNRVLQLINDYDPQMIYFDDTVLPFYGCDDQIGQNILAHYYNHSANRNGGSAQVVAMGKILGDEHKQLMLWDVERGIPDRMQPLPWQTCTCLGQWHYDKNVYQQNRYKSAATVVRMLVDVVSKNGCLLLSVPVKGNGTIDDRERTVLAGIKEWMDVNKESIIGTRPWKTFGEGPLAEAANPLNAQGFNEGFNYTSDDIRFNAKEGTLYATLMAWPASNQTTIRSLAITSPCYSGMVSSVQLMGYGPVEYTMDTDGLHVTLPAARPGGNIAPVLAINFTEASEATAVLEELISALEEQLATLATQAGYNTGRYSLRAVSQMQQLLQDAKSDDATDPETLISQLRQAWQQLLAEGLNAGGSPDAGYEDITVDKLVEASEFSRTDASTTRFGAPKYWTVENFCIPQNNGDGTKQGLDKYNGHSSLMLGVWDDKERNTEGDLANARIYKKVTLPRGRYFFGAAYNQVYNLSSDAYIFAAREVPDVSDVPSQAIAFDYLKDAKGDMQMRGIYFTLSEEQTVVLGFAADLKNSANQQEFRAQTVGLYAYGDVVSEDITVEKLTEASGFAMLEETGKRFGAPKYWTVENFCIPQNNNDGIKQGLDMYTGRPSLMLGIWNDRAQNTEGNLADARIYQTVHLDAGDYFFGATFNAIYQLNKAYVFAATSVLPTSDIAGSALASKNIGECQKDNGIYYGVNFSLSEPADVVLGFQADLASGSTTQEFRADAVKLLVYRSLPQDDATGISPSARLQSSAPRSDVFDLSGRRVAQVGLRQGIYVMGGKKIVR